MRLVTQKQIAAETGLNVASVNMLITRVKSVEKRGRERVYDAEAARDALLEGLRHSRDGALARVEKWNARIAAVERMRVDG